MESYRIVLHFGRTRRQFIGISVGLILILTGLVMERYINFKLEIKLGSVFDEVMIFLYYVSWIFQGGTYVCVIAQQQLLVIGLIQRYRHINNLLR